MLMIVYICHLLCVRQGEGGDAVSSLRLNSRGTRLLIHTRNNQLRTVECKVRLVHRPSHLPCPCLSTRNNHSPCSKYRASSA